MEEQKKIVKENGMDLKTSIIIASVIIAGSLIYLGSQMGGKAEFTAEDFDRLAAGYQERQESGGAEAQAAQQAEADAQAKNVALISDTDHVQGNKDANITIFEYSDFECPFCKQFYKTPAEVVAKSGGKVNTVFRHFPLSFHDPLATKQANASECAASLGGAEMFYQYHDELFKRTNSNIGMDESEIYKIAADLKLDKTKFATCYDNSNFDAKVKADIASGAAAGISGTPGVIIRNNTTGAVRVMPGAVPIEMVEAAIAELSV